MESHAFWQAVQILLRNYHAVNKKIFECITSRVLKVAKGIENAPALLPKDCEECTETDMQTCFQNLNKLAEEFQGLVIYYKLLTRKATENIEAVGVVDFTNSTYTCKFSACDSCDDFRIRYINGNTLAVEILSQRGVDTEIGDRWANHILRPKLLKWAHSVEASAKQVQSLQLVDSENYNNLYKELKSKYAEKTLKFWVEAQESTDPLKFIYEDLAIASYLINLWRHYGTPTAFADLGCGNGLLVYILNEEGFPGYGYDIRARKLWSHYPAATRLQLVEQAIEPHTKLPKEVNWLIGNHSDELSPWLPVLASTASYEMQYFLLPCCAYEFAGCKFQRRTSNKSAYQDFYAYAESISQMCGFKTLHDRLKIPSTKRLALVGVARTYTKDDHQSKCQQIRDYVSREMARYGSAHEHIKLREKHETVRNCTQIDRDVIAALVLKIFHLFLLSGTSPEEAAWQTGGRLSLPQIAKELSKADLLHIKSECGGIKTLLRNKHEIFEFFPDNLIGIRKPQLRTAAGGAKKSLPVKRRACFFKQHHPNGCPLADEQCTFLH